MSAQLLEATMVLSTTGSAFKVCVSARTPVACASLGPRVAASTQPPARSASARLAALPMPVIRRRSLMPFPPPMSRLFRAKFGGGVGPTGAGDRGGHRGQHGHGERERDGPRQVMLRDDGRRRLPRRRVERDGGDEQPGDERAKQHPENGGWEAGEAFLQA